MERTLSAASAQRIVDEVGTLLQRGLLISRPDGFVLASSDSALNGGYVELQFSDPIFPPCDASDETSSADETAAPARIRADILLPVMANGEIFCYVGILGQWPSGETGKQDDIMESAQVIRVMTEILIADLKERQRDAEVRGARDRFLEEWLFSATLPDDKSLETRGRQLGIDVNRTRTAGVLLLDPTSFGEEVGAGEYALIVEGVLELLRKSGGVNGRDVPVTAVGSRIVLLFDTDSVSAAKERLEAARNSVEAVYPIHASCGVGMPRKTFADMRDSAREAERAARNAQASRRREVLAFGDIALELFLQEVPSRLKREYRSRVLRGLSEAEAADWSRMLSVYFQVDGSLAEAANLLGIHKNTLQYRLRRLAVLTGHDPRRLRDALALYLTTIMDENRST